MIVFGSKVEEKERKMIDQILSQVMKLIKNIKDLEKIHFLQRL